MPTYTNNNNVGTVSGNGSSNSSNTLNNSTATSALLGGGNDTLNVLNNSNVTGYIAAGEGNDNVTVDTNSTVGQNSSGDSMAMGGGVDSVTLSDNASVSGNIIMSSGNDAFTMSGGTVGGDVDGGGNDDTLVMTGGTVSGSVSGSVGSDNISISDSTILGDVRGDRGGSESIAGNDNITLSNASISGTVYGDDGADNFTVNSLSNNLVIDGSEGGTDNDTLDLSALTGSIVYDVANPENGVFTEDGTGKTISFSNIENVTAPIAPVCFTTGMAIETIEGETQVEDLKIGDKIPTLDNGVQEIRYIYMRSLPLDHLSLPICLEVGAIGNDRKMIVSQKHCFYTGSLPIDCIPPSARGNTNHLIHADMLVNGTTIRYDYSQKTLTYFHIMFSKHELIKCHGTWSESWHPIRRALQKDKAMAKEIKHLFPEINHQNAVNTPAARPLATRFMKHSTPHLMCTHS